MEIVETGIGGSFAYRYQYKVGAHDYFGYAESESEALAIIKERGRVMTLCKECEGDGCSLCTVFCGDCLTPAEECGCKI